MIQNRLHSEYMHDEETCKAFKFSGVVLYDQDDVLHRDDHGCSEDLLIFKI